MATWLDTFISEKKRLPLRFEAKELVPGAPDSEFVNFKARPRNGIGPIAQPGYYFAKIEFDFAEAWHGAYRAEVRNILFAQALNDPRTLARSDIFGFVAIVETNGAYLLTMPHQKVHEADFSLTDIITARSLYFTFRLERLSE